MISFSLLLFEQVIDSWGTIDILVNNAGISKSFMSFFLMFGSSQSAIFIYRLFLCVGVWSFICRYYKGHTNDENDKISVAGCH